MKKFLFYAVSLLLVLPAMAQTPVDVSEAGAEKISSEGLVISDGQVARLKKVPSFKNKGFEKYWKWVLSRVQYPADMEEQKVEGLVQVKIIVETDGSVTVGEVLASPHERLTEAVTRVVENSPKWTPGIMTDKESGLDYPVRVSYVLPVEFKVRPQKLVDPTIGRYNGQKNFKPYGSCNVFCTGFDFAASARRTGRFSRAIGRRAVKKRARLRRKEAGRGFLL